MSMGRVRFSRRTGNAFQGRWILLPRQVLGSHADRQVGTLNSATPPLGPETEEAESGGDRDGKCGNNNGISVSAIVKTHATST